MASARPVCVVLEDQGDTCFVQCPCGEGFWCDAYGDNVYLHGNGDQRPLCPKCGTELNWKKES